MKATTSTPTLAALAFLSSFFLIGCYTQLAITDDEPSASVEPQTTEIVGPPPTVVIIEPVYVPPIASPYQPSSVYRPSSPGTGTQSPPPSPQRDSGISRTGTANPVNPPAGSGSTNRGGNSARGGR